MILLLPVLSLACNEGDEDPKGTFIDESCRIKWIANDYYSTTFLYNDNLIVSVDYTDKLTSEEPKTYVYNYYQDWIEYTTESNAVDRAYYEYQVLVKRIEGRLYSSDPPFFIFSKQSDYIYDDQGQLSRILITYTDNETNQTWEEIQEFEWKDGNISRMCEDGRCYTYTYETNKNPFQGNIAIVMAANWQVPWIYFNSNNMISIEDQFGRIIENFTYDFNNSIYPTTIHFENLNLATRIGYSCGE